MIYTLEIFCIFFAVPSIRAVSLRIDGLIDLGPNWNYEYRVLSPRDSQPKRDSSRDEDKDEFPLAADPKYDSSDDEHLREDEERLRKAEERLRQEADQLHLEADQVRKATHPHQPKTETYKYHHPQIEFYKYVEAPVKDTIIGVRNQESTHKRHHSSHKTEEKPRRPNATEVSEVLAEHSKNKISEIIIQYGPEFDSETKESKHDTPKATEPSKLTTQSTSAKPITWSSASDEDSSSDSSSMKATRIVVTMFDMNDFTTTKKPKTPPTREDIETPMKQDVSNDDDIKSYPRPIKREHNATVTTRISTTATTKTTVLVTNATTPTTTQVTTVRTGDIYSNPHKIKDDEKINEFTNHIYKQTLKVFEALKQKTNECHLKKHVDVIAKCYETKFKEFLRETRNQKIKTRLGTQKVVLNTIDMSNRILKRLINYMIGDMEKKGVLRHGVAAVHIFQKEIDKEQSLELGHACKKFGICRSGNGFPEFLTDIFTIVLKCDDKKFKQTIDAMTEVVKSTDFDSELEYNTEIKFKASMDKFEQLDITTLRPMLTIIKNIITNKNKPLTLTSTGSEGYVNATLGLLEIIDLLDQNIPKNEANNLEWNDIKTSLADYSHNKRYDIQDIMETLMKHIKKSLKSFDSSSQKIISKNINVLIDSLGN